MSIDRSLKVKGALSRHRNVLSRGERIETLKLEERFTDGDTVMGLPKVAHRKAATGKKEAKVKVAATPEAEAAAAAGTPAAPPTAQPPQQKKAAAKK
ncbi:MAG: small basic protein [Planctomycetes bacterium]|nr:small basic protein [Planctomycetota bacterium]